MRQYQRLRGIPCLIALLCVFQAAQSQPVLWESAKGPYGSAINNESSAGNIGIAPDNNVFVSGINGVFISQDNGETWIKSTSNVGRPASYAFTSSGRIFAASGGRIIASDDDGKTWNDQSFTSSAGSIHALITGDDDMLILGAGADGAYTSSDDGQTWIQRLKDVYVSGLAYDPASGDIFAVVEGPQQGVHRSNDNGRTWTQVYGGEGFSMIAIDPVNGLAFAGSGRALIRSADAGATWTPATLPAESLAHITFAPNGDAFAFGFPSSLRRSSDGGATWSADLKPAIAEGQPLNDIRFNAAGDIFIHIASLGVFRSQDNGDSWVKVGVPSVEVQTFTLAPGGNIFAGTDNNGMYHSANDGDSWEFIALDNVNVTSLAVNPNGDILAGTARNGVQISRDNGATWSAIRFTNRQIFTLVANADGDFFAGTRGDGVFKGTADGESWRNITSEIQNLAIQSLAVAPSGTIYAGRQFNDEWALAEYDFLYRSNDGGEQWTAVATAGPPELNGGISVNAIVVNQDGVVFYASESQGESPPQSANAIMRSFDEGATWESTGFPDNIRVLSLLINDIGHIYAGTQGHGAYRSTDNGDTWEQVSDGLSDMTVRSMTLNSSGFLFASTPNSGIFRSQQPVQITSLNPSSPVREALRQPQRVTLRWGMPENAVTYRVQLGGSPTFEHSVFMDQSGIGAAFRKVEGLAKNTTYFWRVGATDAAGEFHWSQHSVFSTGALISSVDDPDGAGRDNLSRVAPNPFRRSTTIMFTTESNAFVRLAITDVLGNTVATLLARELPAGEHSFDWDAAEFASGTYFYTLRINDRVETHKLLRR